MTHGPTRVSGKGCCIYCGRTDVELTDEHAVPLALGGQHIIENASCRECAKITSRFEMDVLRKMWGAARIYYNAPSRHRKLRPDSITLVNPENGDRVAVPHSEYPAPFIFYTMNRAGFLEGFPEGIDISGLWQISTITDDEKAKAFQAKFGIPLLVKFGHFPDSFARMIAKIGYCQILTVLDLADFQPMCLPYILGEKANLSYIVGGASTPPLPNAGTGYVLKTAAIGDEARLVLIAEVRLYANADTPTYHVVVGDVRGRESVCNVMTKLGECEGVPLKPGTPTPEIPWLPTRWPLTG